MSRQNGLNLRNLVNFEEWQKIQDSFSEVLGITLGTFDQNGKLLSRLSGPTRLCTEIQPVNSTHSGFFTKCLSKAKRGKKIDIKETANIKCPFGLDLFALPIRAFGNRIAAYISIGPVILNKRKEKSEYEKCAKKAGIEPEELLDGLIEINVFTHTKIRSIIDLLTDVFSYVAQAGYHKKRLGEIGQDVIEIDPLFSHRYEQRILGAFLKTCTNALSADSGSIMVLDKKTQTLHIKVASRLDKEIVHKTDVRMGEGIAGIAAATAEPIVLPKDKNKNGLSKKMKRAYIKSSLIVPLQRAIRDKTDKNNVYGVINLNIIRKKRDFSNRDISLIKELVNLAGIALLPVGHTK